MSQTTPRPSQKLPKPWKWILGAGAIALGILSIQPILDARTYDQGEQAYRTANCADAIAQFNSIINSPRWFDTNDYVARSKARIEECKTYLSTIQPSNTPQLIAYDDFANRYSDSPLVGALRRKLAQDLQGQQPEQLAEVSVCDRLPSLINHQLLPNADKALPIWQYACGQTYAKNSNFAQANALFQQFLQEHPRHEQVRQVETAFAASMVAEANASGAGRIARPGQSGRVRRGTTVVQIRNDSPETLRIVFSGPEPRFEELAPCAECEPLSAPPSACPAKGPRGTYTLKPGDYDVLVRSTSNGQVTPFTGKWELGSGSEYSSCFFIVRQAGS